MPGQNSAWYAFVRWLVRTLYFGLVTGGMRSVGEENVPRTGAVIVAPNHVSNLDPPITACGTKRQIAFMAKEQLFKGIFGKLIASLGAFPVRRGEGDTESIRKAIALLEEGRALLVFPEGTRGDGGTMLPINRGVGMLAKRTGAQVVPVGIAGTHMVMPRGKKGRRHPITITYGRPFTYKEIAEGHSDKEARDLFAQELENRIRALCASGGLELKSALSAPRSEAYPAPETGSAPPPTEPAETRCQT
jgi:1-acyl-sn-glycerol-3-phosphate acyltransferase